ncbi:MAG: hypothetical protein IPL33_05055 [Sphingobacteriales bacterium]|nr:hypothetical protein [Sphingobacteriales bacterium]
MPIISSEPPLLVGIDRIATLAAQWHSHPAGLPNRYVCEITADNAIDKSDTALERRQRERMAVRACCCIHYYPTTKGASTMKYRADPP